MPRFAVILLLMGCAGYPDLGRDSPTVERAGYPQLIPLSTILAGVQSERLFDPTLSRDLQARAQRLRARAAAMRRNAVTDADKARMRAAVARHSR